MSQFAAIPLEQYPMPEIIRRPSFDAFLDEMRTAVIEADPSLAEALHLESEPTTKALRVAAFYRMLDRVKFNDLARGNMLAYATGTDLDHLAAFWTVQRQEIDPGDPTALPPRPRVMEDDASLRRRTQLAPEGLSVAGPRGAYIFHALSADGRVKDASVDSPAPGEVRVTILSREGDGTPADDLLTAVGEVLTDEDVRPLTDNVTVRAATVVSYRIEAELVLLPGPDAGVVLEAARTAVLDYAETSHRLGYDITRSGLYAALHPVGVQNVRLKAPLDEIVLGPGGAAWLSEPPVLTVGGRDV